MKKKAMFIKCYFVFFVVLLVFSEIPRVAADDEEEDIVPLTDDEIERFLTKLTRPYIRGDVNDDERMDISDAVFILQYLFNNQDGKRLQCPRTADVNSDNKIDITDGVSLLRYLFQGGPAPPDPKVIDPDFTPPECSDTHDNDNNGLIDLDDPKCSDANDNDETTHGRGQPPVQCFIPESQEGEIEIAYIVNDPDALQDIVNDPDALRGIQFLANAPADSFPRDSVFNDLSLEAFSIFVMQEYLKAYHDLDRTFPGYHVRLFQGFVSVWECPGILNCNFRNPDGSIAKNGDILSHDGTKKIGNVYDGPLKDQEDTDFGQRAGWVPEWRPAEKPQDIGTFVTESGISLPVRDPALAAGAVAGVIVLKSEGGVAVIVGDATLIKELITTGAIILTSPLAITVAVIGELALAGLLAKPVYDFAFVETITHMTTATLTANSLVLASSIGSEGLRRSAQEVFKKAKALVEDFYRDPNKFTPEEQQVLKQLAAALGTLEATYHPVGNTLGSVRDGLVSLGNAAVSVTDADAFVGAGNTEAAKAAVSTAVHEHIPEALEHLEDAKSFIVESINKPVGPGEYSTLPEAKELLSRMEETLKTKIEEINTYKSLLENLEKSLENPNPPPRDLGEKLSEAVNSLVGVQTDLAQRTKQLSDMQGAVERAANKALTMAQAHTGDLMLEIAEKFNKEYGVDVTSNLKTVFWNMRKALNSPDPAVSGEILDYLRKRLGENDLTIGGANAILENLLWKKDEEGFKAVLKQFGRGKFSPEDFFPGGSPDGPPRFEVGLKSDSEIQKWGSKSGGDFRVPPKQIPYTPPGDDDDDPPPQDPRPPMSSDDSVCDDRRRTSVDAVEVAVPWRLFPLDHGEPCFEAGKKSNEAYLVNVECPKRAAEGTFGPCNPRASCQQTNCERDEGNDQYCRALPYLRHETKEQGVGDADPTDEFAIVESACVVTTYYTCGCGCSLCDTWPIP